MIVANFFNEIKSSASILLFDKRVKTVESDLNSLTYVFSPVSIGTPTRSCPKRLLL
jgi:hypothetical protein